MTFSFDISDISDSQNKPINDSLNDSSKMKFIEFNSNYKPKDIFRRETLIRSSLISTIDQCKRKAYYDYVELGVDAEDELSGTTYLATFLGTGGHKLIEYIHRNKKFNLDPHDEISIVMESATEQFNSESFNMQSKLSREELLEDLEDRCIEIVSLVNQYKKHEANKNINIVNYEQEFIIPIKYKNINGLKYTESDTKQTNSQLEGVYYIKGTIDQIGFYNDGSSSVRDIKFRDNSFRPSLFEVDLMKQLVIYSIGMKYGYPVCDSCRPKYVHDLETMQRKIEFNGICEDCFKKMNTPLWPRDYPDYRELIWMRDFERYNRNYKNKRKGQLKGKGIYKIPNIIPMLERYFFEIFIQAVSFLNGYFERSPGEHCMRWCSKRKECIRDISYIDLENKYLISK